MRSMENLTATFHHGEHVSLTKFWQDKDVICPNTKVFYILSGEIVIETDEERILGKEGDMVLIPAGTRHDYHLSDKGFASKYWMHVDILLDGKNLFDFYSLPFKIHVDKNEYLENLFETVLRLGKSEKLSHKLTTSSTLLSIISFYAEHCEYLDNRPGDEIDESIKYIKNHYKEKITLDELCKRANFSKGHFVRKFKERTGYTPMHYINLLKIDKAKTMIEQLSAPISDIMEELGFLDSAHFSKLFKLHTGYSPKKFRELNGYRNSNKSI